MVNISSKFKFIIIIFSIILTIIYFGPFCNLSNAINADFWTGEFRDSEKNSSSDGIPNTGMYKPTIDPNPISRGKLEKILSILQVIGVIGTVIAVAFVGLKTILGSANEKAIEKEKYMGILVAAVMITSGITIAKFIISIVE